MAQETKQVSHLVIAAFWAHGEPEDLCRDSAEALRAVRIPGAKGSVVTFPKATVDDKTFRAVLMKLDLADVAPSLTASYVGGPRDETGGEVESIDAIPLDGGEYRFQEIGSDLDAVFVWHPAEGSQSDA